VKKNAKRFSHFTYEKGAENTWVLNLVLSDRRQ